MEKNVKWFENVNEAREHFVGETRSHGVVFEPKEVTEEPKETKKKTGSKKKADKDE